VSETLRAAIRRSFSNAQGMTVMPIHACQHLYFASIHRPQADILFAFHNGFLIIRFICTIVMQPAQMRSKINAL
jgi:hypothetical protein